MNHNELIGFNDAEKLFNLAEEEKLLSTVRNGPEVNYLLEELLYG